MQKLQDIAFVSNAGSKKRVLARAGAVYYAGCFEGTKDELINAISKEYSGKDAEAYVSKVNELENRHYTDFEDIHARNNFALRWAANNGCLEVVEYLVEKGADIQAYNNYALRWAAENGHAEVVAFLKSLG